MANATAPKTPETGENLVRRGLRFESGRGLCKKPASWSFPFRSTCRCSSVRWIWSCLWSFQVEEAPSLDADPDFEPRVAVGTGRPHGPKIRKLSPAVFKSEAARAACAAATSDSARPKMSSKAGYDHGRVREEAPRARIPDATKATTTPARTAANVMRQPSERSFVGSRRARRPALCL